MNVLSCTLKLSNFLFLVMGLLEAGCCNCRDHYSWMGLNHLHFGSFKAFGRPLFERRQNQHSFSACSCMLTQYFNPVGIRCIMHIPSYTWTISYVHFISKPFCHVCILPIPMHVQSACISSLPTPAQFSRSMHSSHNLYR